MLEIKLKEGSIIIETGVMSFMEEVTFHTRLDAIRNFSIQDKSTVEKYRKGFYFNRGGSAMGSSSEWSCDSHSKEMTELLTKLFTAILEDPAQEFTPEKFGLASAELKQDSNVVSLIKE